MLIDQLVALSTKNDTEVVKAVDDSLDLAAGG
jgi:hypothetical protein